MNSGVYKIAFGLDWAYIGQTTNFSSRWANHRKLLRAGNHWNKILQNGWNKYGESAVSFVILERAAEGLSGLEQKYIDEARAAGRCCNVALTADPPRGWRHSESTKAAARARAVGRKVSEETREKLRQAMLNRQAFSPEKKAEIAQKISAAHKGRIVSEETRNLLRQSKLGSKQTPQSNAKRSATQTGQKRGPEFSEKARQAKLLSYKTNPGYKEKLSAALKARHKDPGMRAVSIANLPDTRKSVCCSNGIVYPSIAEASRATGVHANTIRRRCHGQATSGKIKLQFWFAP